MNPERWKLINLLLDQAFELETEKRDAFLEKACAGDAALKQEVEKLLQSDERGASFIEIPAAQAVAESIAKSKLLPGNFLGPYKIVSQIGAGGMGEVYRAYDSRLDRFAALKILHGHLAKDPERMRRFQQEAKAASKLSHPNVAHIYEIGSSEGIRFIAMEHVEGQTLDARISKGRLEIDEVINIAMQVSDALDEAHQKGITHRDIKPANIMIKDKGHVKVLDFGLAKIFQPSNDSLATQLSTIAKTQTGLVFGTVPYMSPEQALGRDVDQRSDIFSLGCVLYQMVTNKRPFTGISNVEILDHILHAEPEPIVSSNEKAPVELQWIIRKCMENDRDRRYQSCRDLYVDLKNLQRGTAVPVAFTPTGRPPRSKARSGAAAIAALLLIAFAAAVSVWRAQHPPRIHSIAVIPFLNVEKNPETEYLSDGITESTINALSLLPDMKVMAPGTVFTYKGKILDPRKVGRDLNVDAVLSGRFRQQGDSLILEASLASVSDGSLLWGNQFKRLPSRMTDLPGEITRDLSRKLQLNLTGQEEKLASKQYTMDSEAYRSYLKGRYFFNKRTMQGFDKAVEYFREAIDKDPNYALAYAGLAEVYARGDDMTKTKAAAKMALELDDTLAEAHVSMAVVKELEWDLAGAEAEYKKAIELNPNLANAHTQYGDLFAIKGDLDKAIEHTKLAQQLDPLNAHITTALSNKLGAARRYDEALAEIHKAIEMDPGFPMAHGVLAGIYLDKGMYQESIQEQAKAMTLRGRPQEYVTQRTQALLDGLRQKGVKGYWEKRLELAQNGNGNLNEQVDPVEVAALYVELGQKDEAFRWLEKAYEQRQYELVYIKSEPHWDSIRSDPRYSQLLKKCGLL